VTALQNKAENQTAGLSPADVEAIGRELDAMRQAVLDSRGATDAAYIRRLIRVQRGLELSGRALLLASSLRPAWIAGTLALALAKTLDTMEIGHNVLHGQWDWMRDPKVQSTTWEWDYATPSELWRRTHNEGHHVFTNILGKDNDLGYGILRVDEDQPWRRIHLSQPLLNAANALFFEYGIAAYDAGFGGLLRGENSASPQLRADVLQTWRKVRRQATKDFLVWPLLSGPSFRHTLTANITACLLRNVWSHSVIMCGHFPEGVETFEQQTVPPDETRARWYLRQMLGSADITGPPLLHVLAGNLSHQIEHHLFPDLPSNRYAELAPQVRSLLDRHGLQYHAASLPRQVASAWHKVLRLSLPNGWLADTTWRNVPGRVVGLFRRTATAAREGSAAGRAVGIAGSNGYS
jgi:linoleoyl-CoA desaturase